MQKWVVLMLLLSAGPAKAADYYVATSGSNSNPGTLAQPFLTIQKAADMVTAGGNVYVRGGTYRETVTMSNSRKLPRPDHFPALRQRAGHGHRARFGQQRLDELRRQCLEQPGFDERPNEPPGVLERQGIAVGPLAQHLVQQSATGGVLNGWHHVIPSAADKLVHHRYRVGQPCHQLLGRHQHVGHHRHRHGNRNLERRHR